MRLLSLAALLAAAASVHAADAPTTPASKPEGEKVLKVVCKLEKPIGSQMLKRRCYTQDQMDIDHEDARRSVSEMQK